jgi:hypothetical protein
MDKPTVLSSAAPAKHHSLHSPHSTLVPTARLLGWRCSRSSRTSYSRPQTRRLATCRPPLILLLARILRFRYSRPDSKVRAWEGDDILGIPAPNSHNRPQVRVYGSICPPVGTRRGALSILHGICHETLLDGALCTPRVMHADSRSCLNTQTSTFDNSTNVAPIDEALAALVLHDMVESLAPEVLYDSPPRNLASH